MNEISKQKKVLMGNSNFANIYLDRKNNIFGVNYQIHRLRVIPLHTEKANRFLDCCSWCGCYISIGYSVVCVFSWIQSSRCTAFAIVREHVANRDDFSAAELK